MLFRYIYEGIRGVLYAAGMQAGWEFSLKQMGAEYAAHIGDAYIHEVDVAIEKLAKDMQELGAKTI